MRSIPLFGKDSEPQHTSNLLSLIITVVLWLAFGVCMIFVPVGKKQKLKPVQIVLSSTPVEKKIIPRDSASTSQNASGEQASEVVEKVHSETPVVDAKPETAPAPAPEPAPVETPKPVVETPKPVEPKPQPVKKVEPKPEPVKKAAPKPVEKKTEPVKKVEPKPAPEKTVTKPVPTPAPVEEVVLSKSVEDLMAEQMNAKKAPKKEIDWDAMFGDDEPADTTSSSQPQKVLADNKLEGSSGSVSQTKTANKPVSSTVTEEAVNKNVSSKTSSNLANIQNATNYKSSSGGSEGTVKAQTAKDGTGKTLMTMTSGSARSLIDPVEPVIKLSAEAGSMIESTITVEIKFTVLAGGNISGITITPEAILPASVRNEIKSQIAFWRFEASDSSDTAKFEYTIKKQ